MTPLIRVSIVEDDREVRDGLSWLFRHSQGFKNLDCCGSGEEALLKIPRNPPDVIMLDIHLPGRSGIECLPELKRQCPTAQITMLTVIEDDELIFRSLEVGAMGYLLKSSPPAAILEGVRELHAGGSPITSLIARKLLNVIRGRVALRPQDWPSTTRDSSASILNLLCPRERQVLDLLAQGFRYKEIADRLGITIHTVRTFIRSMYEKLQVHSRTEAVIRLHDFH